MRGRAGVSVSARIFGGAILVCLEHDSLPSFFGIGPPYEYASNALDVAPVRSVVWRVAVVAKH